MTLLQGLGRSDWTALRHAYGPAGDVPELLPALAERATDASPAVRGYATHLLAALDEDDAALPADRFAGLLAERLDDTAPLARHGTDRIADLAAWGLSRRRDPRCLPYLIDRLGGEVFFVDAVSGPSGPFSNEPARRCVMCWLRSAGTPTPCSR